MKVALLGGGDRSVRKRPATRQLASLQSVQFRKETTWLTNRITVCNALIATVQRRHGASKNRERERKNLRNAKPNAQ